MSGLFEQAASFAPYAHRDLRVLLGVTTPAPWPAVRRWQPAPAGEAVTELPCPPARPDPARRPSAGRCPTGSSSCSTRSAPRPAAAGGHREHAQERRGPDVGRAADFGDALASCEADYRLDYDPDRRRDGVRHRRGGPQPGRRVRHAASPSAPRTRACSWRTASARSWRTSCSPGSPSRSTAVSSPPATSYAGMNADTRSRPMSSGTAIGIRWAHSDRIDDRQRATSRLLARDAQGLSPPASPSCAACLREMIRDYRASHPRATYKEVLARGSRLPRLAHLRAAAGRARRAAEVRLTRAKHSVMSGGEKSAAIHLPLFAAANALYSSAGPHCPRMIALDEAFAGIDEQVQARPARPDGEVRPGPVHDRP